MSKRIAVLVSGGGTNLQALIDAQARGELVNGEIAAVISSNPGAYALERAAKAGIPGYVVARKEFPSSQAMTTALVEQLRALDIDLVVLAGFMVILTSEMVRAFPNAILNVHPALIPSFAGPGCYGLHVHEKALEYGVKLSGATVHVGVRRRPHRLTKGGGGPPGRHPGGPSAADHGAVRVEAPAPGGLPVLSGPPEGGGPSGPGAGPPGMNLLLNPSYDTM